MFGTACALGAMNRPLSLIKKDNIIPISRAVWLDVGDDKRASVFRVGLASACGAAAAAQRNAVTIAATADIANQPNFFRPRANGRLPLADDGRA